MENLNNTNDYLLSSVKNSLRLLNSFSLDEPEKKVTDLAKTLGLGKSTVSRLLATLASEGFVIKDQETQKYRLGLSILNLNTIVSSNLEIGRESLPILHKLVEETQETCHIAVIDGTDVIYINKVEGKHPVQILTHIGRRNPAYCTSSGRILLAYQDEQVLERALDGELEAYTEKTDTNPESIRSQIKKAKEQGYSVSIEQLRVGVISISAPVRDYTDHVTNTVTLVGPTQRLNASNMKTHINKVISAANEVSARLGYRKRH
jgi:IclR family KDG regulon transcriptional repressor